MFKRLLAINNQFVLAVLLLGNTSLSVFTLGTIRVVMSMKKMSKRKTRSVMDDISNFADTLFRDLIAIIVMNNFDYRLVNLWGDRMNQLAGSCSRSINSIEVFSILKTTFSTIAESRL